MLQNRKEKGRRDGGGGGGGEMDGKGVCSRRVLTSDTVAALGGAVSLGFPAREI